MILWIGMRGIIEFKKCLRVGEKRSKMLYMSILYIHYMRCSRSCRYRYRHYYGKQMDVDVDAEGERVEVHSQKMTRK